MEARGSYILQVRGQGELLLLVLQDLRSGERLEFTSWDSLGVYLQERFPFKLR